LFIGIAIIIESGVNFSANFVVINFGLWYYWYYRRRLRLGRLRGLRSWVGLLSFFGKDGQGGRSGPIIFCECDGATTHAVDNDGEVARNLLVCPVHLEVDVVGLSFLHLLLTKLPFALLPHHGRSVSTVLATVEPDIVIGFVGVATLVKLSHA
jgi:hypothetical protein